MEERISQLQNQIQVVKMLQHSMTETLIAISGDLSNQTFTEVSRAYMSLESEVLKKEREIVGLKLL
jgi:uncharacterized protein YerC